MRRAVDVVGADRFAPSEAESTITLPFDERYRRRIRMTDDAGHPFMLDLSDATLLGDGDGLLLEEGGIIAVRAAPEPVADLICDDIAHAARLAWHIGNRHTPVQVLDDGVLRIAADHVLVAMAEGLGARVVHHAAPFQPEPGAYAGAADHHGHDPHDHDHHSHAHDH